MFKQQIQQQLDARKEQGLLRTVNDFDFVQASKLGFKGREYLNFSSNDYLGIAQDNRAPISGAGYGATSSPLVVGSEHHHQALKSKLLTWLEVPSDFSCVLFSSGFAANSGVITALFNHRNGNAFLFQDKLNHASLLESGSSVQAKGHCRQVRFKHNDINDLQRLFLQKSNRANANMIATEGVFSMDGDSPDLTSMQAFAQQNDILLLIDDAHGIGVRGASGAGSIRATGATYSEETIHIVTFGKALGAQGAAVIAHESIVEYLTNFSKEYIYSTHLSPIQALAVERSIDRVMAADSARANLKSNIETFRSLLSPMSYQLLESDSAIQGIVIGDEQKAVDVAQHCRNQGIWLSAMRYPTVAKGTARLRVTITAKHTEQDLNKLAMVLKDCNV